MSKYIKAIRMLAKMKALDAENTEKLLNAHAEEQDGGPGSGNFGHAGRPGKKGGSAPQGQGGGSATTSSGSGTSVPSMSEYRKQLAKEPGRPKEPMGYVKGKVPSAEKQKLLTTYRSSPSKGTSPVMKEKTYTFKGRPVSEKTNEMLSRTDRKRANAESLSKSFKDTADWCSQHESDFEEGSIEQKAYRETGEALANHSYRRPTPEDSAKMIQERLSNISSKLRPSAVERYKKDMQNEPQITSDLCDIADELGVQMHGLDFRTKVAGDNKYGVCRIQQKIEQDLAEDAAKAKAKGEEPKLTYDDCVNGLNDLVRYTQMSTEDSLVENYEKTRKALEEKGYKVVKVKNFYGVDPKKNPYRGLTCVFEKNGTKFELQFHTPRSLVAKNAMHPIFEIDRNYDPNNPDKSTVTEEEHMAYQERMRRVSTRERVPYPRGIEKIEDYPPKKK